MQYTPDYTITLPSGEEIPLLFINWTFRQYSMRKGIDLDDLQSQLQGAFADKDNPKKPFPLTEIPSIVLLAHEAWCKANKLPFDKDEFDADNWIDETGGVGSEVYAKTFQLFLTRFFRLNDSAVSVEKEGGEESGEKPKAKKKAATAS